MMRRLLTSTTLAIAGLACVAGSNVAGAAISTGAAGTSAQARAQQPVRLVQTVTTEQKAAKKTRHKKVEHPQTNWLNPQPEPPMSGKKPIQGGNWLNPQPEPPRPDTTKKLQ